MRGLYEDILSRIPEPPTWYDEYGAPRYKIFEPGDASFIYARINALVEVACQCCCRSFNVVCIDDDLEALIREGNPFLYGDPPRHDSDREQHNAKVKCGAGESMNTIAIKVLEFWRFEGFGWVRDVSLEGEMKLSDEDRDGRFPDATWTK